MLIGRPLKHLKLFGRQPREIRLFGVLKWTIAGKTAYEVGAILGTTERTANFHMRNICEKLGVVNKNSAIAKAFELKIIV